MKKTIAALVLSFGLSLSLTGCSLLDDILEEEPSQEETLSGEAAEDSVKEETTEPATAANEQDETENKETASEESTSEETAASGSTEDAVRPELENRPNATLGTGEIKWLSEGDVAPDFTVDLVGGDTFTLSDYDDSVVFINFWATWCGYCIEEMPDLDELYDEGYNIICIDCMEERRVVDQFTSQNDYSFLTAYDENGTVSDYYPTMGIPYSVVVKNGIITDIFGGAYPPAMYKEALDR